MSLGWTGLPGACDYGWYRCGYLCGLHQSSGQKFQKHACLLLRDVVPAWRGRRVWSVHVLPAAMRWFPGAQSFVADVLLIMWVWFYGYLYSQQYWLSMYGSDMKFLLKLFK